MQCITVRVGIVGQHIHGNGRIGRRYREIVSGDRAVVGRKVVVDDKPSTKIAEQRHALRRLTKRQPKNLRVGFDLIVADHRDIDRARGLSRRYHENPGRSAIVLPRRCRRRRTGNILRGILNRDGLRSRAGT